MYRCQGMKTFWELLAHKVALKAFSLRFEQNMFSCVTSFASQDHVLKALLDFRPLRVCALTGDSNIVPKMMALVVMARCCSTARLENLNILLCNLRSGFTSPKWTLLTMAIIQVQNLKKKSFQSEDSNLALDPSLSDRTQTMVCAVFSVYPHSSMCIIGTSHHLRFTVSMSSH